MVDDDSDALRDFEQHFRDHVTAVRRYAARAVGDSHADDIVTETFTVVWRKWADVPSTPGLRRAWTYKVAHHVIAHHVRSQFRRGQLVHRAASVRHPGSADLVDGIAGDDRVSRALAALPLAEREAMALVVWADMSPQQAAYSLGCSVSALNSRLTRARKRLVATSAHVEDDLQEAAR